MFTKYKKIPDRFILFCQGFKVSDGTLMKQMPSATQIFADYLKRKYKYFQEIKQFLELIEI